MRLTKQQHREGFNPRLSIYREQRPPQVPRRAQRLADHCHAELTGQAGQDPLLLPMPETWKKPVRRRPAGDAQTERARKAAAEAKREEARTERNFARAAFIFAISAPVAPGSVRDVSLLPPYTARDRRKAKRQRARDLSLVPAPSPAPAAG